MTAFNTLGVIISPQHCRNEEQSELNCENGTMKAYTRKYFDASSQIAASPPSHTGSFPLITAPSRHKSPDTRSASTRPCRTTFRAPSSCSPPIRCATCTENPADTAYNTPLNSHVVVDTSPIAAEAFAPSAPTIAESIYCMTIVVICVRIAGRLKLHTCAICGFNSVQFFFFNISFSNLIPCDFPDTTVIRQHAVSFIIGFPLMYVK